MYDILIVDDEPASRKAVEYVIDWERHGFQIAGEASNGKEALERMASQSFALVITDIRMPVMDGLQLAERIRAASDVPILILSGYEDFEYARRAMRLGVEDYLMKPVEAQELADKLAQIRRQLETKSLAERALHRALPVVRDQWLRHWAHGLLDDLAILDELELPLPAEKAESFAVLLVELDAGWMPKYDRRVNDLKIRRFSVRNVMEEVCRGYGAVFEESDLRFGLIAMGAASDVDGDAMKARAEELMDALLQYTKEAVTVSIGPAVRETGGLATSYLAALRLLEDRPPSQSRDRETGGGAQRDSGGGAQRKAGGAPANARRRLLVAQPLDLGREPGARQIVDNVKRIARERYHQNINLRLIAGEIFLNPTYLGHLFKTQEGVSFSEYLLSLRMERAKELLAATDKKIYEIALEVGYREIDWFYKKFRDYEGMSPGEYRDIRRT